MKLTGATDSASAAVHTLAPAVPTRLTTGAPTVSLADIGAFQIGGTQRVPLPGVQKATVFTHGTFHCTPVASGASISQTPSATGVTVTSVVPATATSTPPA
ncbi:hypothetical protein GCM10020219_035770 [Nonomuraea dietziae]